MTESTVTLHLDTVKADVRAIWEAHGFVPTTHEERRNQQKGHAPQCRCKFCEESRKELEAVAPTTQESK